MDNGRPVNHQTPQNVEAEASLLGAILIDSDALVKIADAITVADFFEARHQRIYEAISQLYEKRNPIDVLTLADQLKGNGFLEMVGGPSYLTELTNFVPTAAHVEQYADIVAQKALRRRLIKASKEMTELSYDESKPIRELIEEAESNLFQVSQQQVKQGSVISIEDIMAESFERLDDLHKDKAKTRGVSTGFRDMDNLLAGLQPSDLFILAARPSMGKAQPLSAKVLTPTGWTTMGELAIGDQVVSVDGEASTVNGIFPQGKKDIYQVTFSDGRSTECCGEHLWKVHYRTWNEPRILNTEQVISMLQKKRYQKRLWIDVFTGDFGHNNPLPVPPWILGLLISEGDFGSLRFSTASKEVLARVVSELGNELSIIHAGNYDYRIVRAGSVLQKEHAGPLPNSLKESLKQLGLWNKTSQHKFIPTAYKHASRLSRLALLQGLLDGDGWTEKHGTIRFSTASQQLANDVAELARSLGMWASVRGKTTDFTYEGERKQGLAVYVVNICDTRSEQVFTLAHKLQRLLTRKRHKKPTFTTIEKVGAKEAQCISVSHESRLYVTDDYIVTHNTAFSLNLAHNVALGAKAPVLVFSLEMSKEQLVDRLLSMESGVDAWALRTGNLTDHDFERIGQAMGALSEAKIFIDDTPNITVSDLRTKARRKAHQQPLGLIIVDYLQLMSGGSKFGNSDNRVQEISEISRGLKGVARELNVPIIALSQLSRSVENRKPQIPQLSDLRESGSIEQDADVVAFIYREEYYNPETDRKSITDILVKKHRNGPTGGIELFFDKEKQRFRSLDTKRTHPFAE